MTKNKKGKKKNKMAGRNRPATPVDAGENSEPVVAGDTSENEDQSDPPRGSASRPASSPDTDSGIDSGRGSPGDDPGSVTAAAETRVKTPPRITEEEEFEDTKSDSPTKMNSEGAEKSVTVESPERNRGSPSPPSEREERDAPEEEPGPEPETQRDDQKESSDTKPQSVLRKKSETPAVVPRTKGASSIKRPKPKEDIKHPLEFHWTFWLSRRNVPWNEALCEVVSFDTCEDFWYYFSRIMEPTSVGEPIVLFKKGIRPEWEDPENAHGSRWNLALGFSGIHAQRMWKELALMIIGGIQFGPLTPHLNGIYCGWKADGIHYSVWVNSMDEPLVRKIGNIIHENLLELFKRSIPMELVPIKGKKRIMAMIR